MSEYQPDSPSDISAYGKYVSLSIGAPAELIERVNNRAAVQTYLDIDDESLLPAPISSVSLASHWACAVGGEKSEAMPYIYGSINFKPSALNQDNYISVEDLLIRIKKNIQTSEKFQFEQLEHDPLSIYLLNNTPYTLRISIDPSPIECAVAIEINDIADIIAATDCNWLQEDIRYNFPPEQALKEITDVFITAVDTLHDTYGQPSADEPRVFHLEYPLADDDTVVPEKSYMTLGGIALHSITVRLPGQPLRSEIMLGENTSAVAFEQLGGLEQPKSLLREYAELFMNPEIGARYGVTPSPLLLYGPPGTGKSSLAEAFATYTDARFEKIASTRFMDKFISESPKQLEELLKKFYTKKDRTVLFFDEIDAFAKKNLTNYASAYLEVQRLLQQHITDEFPKYPHLMLLAATNVDLVDIAEPLTRSGRLKPLHIPKPTDAELRDIWYVTLANRRAFFTKSWGDKDYDDGRYAPHGERNPIPDLGEINYDELAHLTSGMTGSDVDTIISEALLACHTTHRATGELQYITQNALIQAIEGLKRR